MQPHTHTDTLSVMAHRTSPPSPSHLNLNTHMLSVFLLFQSFSFAVTHTRPYQTTAACQCVSTASQQVCLTVCVCLFVLYLIFLLFIFLFFSLLPFLPPSIPSPPAGHARALLTGGFTCAGAETERLKPLFCLFLLGCWIVHVFLCVFLCKTPSPPLLSLRSTALPSPTLLFFPLCK